MKLRDKLNELFRETPKHDEPVEEKELLRQAIIAELDAVNLYQFFAKKSMDWRVKKVMLHIAKDEQHHIHEFEELLEMIDKEYHDQEDHAEEELKDMGISEKEDIQALHSKIKQFFIDNPNPTDKKVHEFAEKMGIDSHKFEEHIYKILSDMLKK